MNPEEQKNPTLTPAQKIETKATLAGLEYEVARSRAKMTRGMPRQAGQDYLDQLGKQARRVTFLGSAQQEIMRLRRILDAQA